MKTLDNKTISEEEAEIIYLQIMDNISSSLGYLSSYCNKYPNDKFARLKYENLQKAFITEEKL